MCLPTPNSHNRVYNYQLDGCAPTYTTIGDAGNAGAERPDAKVPDSRLATLGDTILTA